MKALTRLAVGLICLGGGGLVLAPFWGTPWPGVVLAGLAVIPLALEAWLQEGRAKEQSIAALDEQVTTLLSIVEGMQTSLVTAGESWRVRDEEMMHRVDAIVKTLDKHSNAHLDVAERLEEHDQQINSLRNAVSLRGTLGG